MYCWNCGKKINDDALECPYCGEKTSTEYSEEITKLKRTVDMYVKRNKIGLAGFILGLISFIFPFYFTTAALGLIFSAVGISKRRENKDWNNFATAGLVFSLLSIITYIILLVTISMSLLWVF